MAEMAQAVPQFQYPDLLGQYLRGSMAPGALQQQGLQTQGMQIENQAGGLKLDQLRLMLQNQQMYQDVARNALQRDGMLPGASTGPGATSQAVPTGGVQNGPQGAVSAPVTGSDQGIGGFTPSTLGALALLRGDDPLKTAQGVQDYQLKQRQIQAQGPMALADTVATSAQADQIIRNNPSLQQQWIALAPRLGLDPFKDLNPANARMVATYGYNQLAGSAGLPPKPMPTQMVNLRGPNGQLMQVDPVSNKETEVVGQKQPGYSLEKKWNPDTNQEEGSLIQTSPGGAPAPTLGGAAGGGASTGGGLGSTAGAPVNLGYAKPTDPELKSAMFASEMHAGIDKIRDLEQRGIQLPPRVRTAMLDAAASDDSGVIHQFMSQESVTHQLNKDQQTYMSALMPVLQAFGHSQAGARIAQGQIRQNMESVVPIDTNNKENVSQVNANRQGFYVGALTQAGSAVQMPQYKGTLLPELQRAQGRLKTINGKDYVKNGNQWFQQ